MPATKPLRYTSHSRLCELLRLILGLPEFPYHAEFMYFGNELHALALEEESKGVKLTSKQKAMMRAMLKSLWKNSTWMWLKKICSVEVEHYGELHGTMIKAYLDLWCPEEKIVADLKTTNCETKEQFLAKAFYYGYFRQAVIYMAITGATRFLFVGIQKRDKNPKVFILDVNDYPELLKYAKHEVEFLLWYFNKYGSSMLKPKVKLNEAA